MIQIEIPQFLCTSISCDMLYILSLSWNKKNNFKKIKKEILDKQVKNHVHFFLSFLDVDLLICKHQGPSCCTRKMEESYQFAVKRETLHNIHSYSYELEHLISGHSDAFQGKSWDKGAKLGLGGIGLKHWVVVDGREGYVGIPWLMICHLSGTHFYLPLRKTDTVES